MRERLKSSVAAPAKPDTIKETLRVSDTSTAEISALQLQVADLTTALAESQRNESASKEKLARMQVRVRERLAELEHQIVAQADGGKDAKNEVPFFSLPLSGFHD